MILSSSAPNTMNIARASRKSPMMEMLPHPHSCPWVSPRSRANTPMPRVAAPVRSREPLLTTIGSLIRNTVSTVNAMKNGTTTWKASYQ